VKKSEPKKLKVVNEKTLIVTIDIGKVVNMGYCRCPDRTEVKPFKFHNNREGFNKFWGCVSEIKAAKALEEIVVGLESTGAYGEPLMHYLKDKPVRLVQVNPMHTKKLKELQGNSPNKTDNKDPKVIADIIELGHALTVVIPRGTAAELRRLTQARERSIQRRTALFNQLQDLVFTTFPEFLQVMKNVKTKTAQYLLRHHPTPQDIVEYGLEPLTSTLKRVSRGKLGAACAKTLYEAAKKSVGIKEGQASIVFEIQEILLAIEASERSIALFEEKLSEHLKQIPYSPSILSIKGIGEITAAGLIGEVGDFTKFNTVSELLKHAGLDLFEVSSGKHKGKRRISKRGRPLFRKLLFFAAVNTVRKGGIMHKHYQRHLQKGMKKIKALVAIARKLLSIIFALVRDHSEYVTDYLEIQNLKLAA
jgi:transposase